MDEKNGVLELGELEYHKKWYFPNYFPNSVSGLHISKINANGPFCPTSLCSHLLVLFSTITVMFWATGALALTSQVGSLQLPLEIST